MSQYIMFEVMEGAYDISCPDRDCPIQGFQISDIKYFYFQCMSQYMMLEVMEGAYDISCPDPDRDCLQLLGFLYSCFKHFCFQCMSQYILF